MAATGQQEARADLLTSVMIGTGVVLFGLPFLAFIVVTIGPYIVANPWTWYFIGIPIFFVIGFMTTGKARRDHFEAKEAELYGWDWQNHMDEIYDRELYH